MKHWKGVLVTLLLVAGAFAWLCPAVFVNDAAFSVGSSAVAITERVGAKADLVFRTADEVDFWLKTGCPTGTRQAIASVLVYQRFPRQTVALGLDATDTVRCVRFSRTLTFLH